MVAEYRPLKDYKVHSVTGDAYGAAWVETSFTKQGIKYIRSEMNKSQLYLEMLPGFMRQNLSIPNHPRLLRELRLLERRTSAWGVTLSIMAQMARTTTLTHSRGAFDVLQAVSM